MKQLKGYSCYKVRDMEKAALDKYKDMNEDALVDALLDNVRKSKADGTYSAAELMQFAEMMSPHLTQEKRERLANLIRLINSDV